MTNRAGVYGYWSSSPAFVLVGTGAAIGFGNIFSLPYLLGHYGGGAFLIVYMLSLLLVSLPLLVAELLMGRRSRANVVRTAHLLAKESDVHLEWIWPWMGRLALVGAVLVLSYYSVVAGWSMAYVIRSANGTLSVTNAAQIREVVLALVGDPERTLAWHTIFMISATVFVAHGRAGIERVASYLVPLAFLCLFALLINALFVGNVGASLRLLFTPDFSRLGWEGALEALQQAFFSLSLGMGVMVTFGIYLPERTSLLQIGSAVVLIDLLFALMSGLVVSAYIFAAGEVPKRGVTFVFEQLPLAINQHSGSVPSLIFLYFSLFLATMTSAMGLMEPITVWMMERYDISRSFASTSAGVIIWFFGLGTILSFNAWQNMLAFGRTFYEWVDLLTGHLLLPIVGLWVCVFVSRAMPHEVLKEAWGGGSQRGFTLWMFCLRYPARIGLALVMLYTMGLFKLITYLW